MRSIVALAFVACCPAFSQQTGPQLTFEVASVKPSPPPELGVRRRIGCRGGPGDDDPGLFRCDNASAASLVRNAHRLETYQLSAPDWMESMLFDISARVPPGITRDQLRTMLQNLLAERFQLAVHHEQRELPMYELTLAKSGRELKESPGSPSNDPPPPAQPGKPRFPMGNDGLPVFPPRTNMMVMMPGRARRQAADETMERFAQFLSTQLHRPVVDATGLTGKYDITLTWAYEPPGMPPSPDAGSAADAEPLPDLIQAVQSLGLKLEQKKGPVDVLVVDHMEKTAKGN
jgi:uncharacterized protein (TIGR03435 family)